MVDDRHVEIVAAAAFTIAALLHGIRLVFDWSFVFGPYTVPAWLSALDVAISGPLAVWFWRRAWERRG